MPREPLTLDECYKAHGIPSTYEGKFHEEFAKLMQKKVDQGLLYMSAMIVSPDQYESIVRMWLSVDWQTSQGHTFPLHKIDGEWNFVDWFNRYVRAPINRFFRPNPYQKEVS